MTVAFITTIIAFAVVVVVVGSGGSAAGCLVGLQRASGQARTHLSPHADVSHEGLQAERHHICAHEVNTKGEGWRLNS
jgi:1-aminocyclopropane-1-carboxylate deaminase/D-cysteine desulfhydrase-like pyridoxal-dependent ACC family enzyme